MNKTGLIQFIASNAELTKSQASRALDAIIAGITSTLSEEEQVVLVGFGTFSVKDRAARSCRNPQTGDIIELAATKVPYFKAGKTLKDAVSGKVAQEAE